MNKGSGNVGVGFYKEGDLVLIEPVTMIHPGIGRGGGIVDLPVQRDSLDFPIIFSSSIKGSLKSLVWNMNERDAIYLFGSEPDDVEKKQGRTLISDGFLTIFPVRSLVGVYGFITSPFLLRRLMESTKLVISTGNTSAKLRYLKLTIDTLLKEIEPNLPSDVCYMSHPKLLEVKPLGRKVIINEEIVLMPKASAEVSKLEEILQIEAGRLMIVDDSAALDAVNRGTLKVTRVRLERGVKKVKRGGLWTEEYIPQKTMFHATILYAGSSSSVAQSTKERFHEFLKKSGYYAIIGGNETIGKGIVKIIIVGD
jgi:CRISPR-associated protein Cmr4